MKHGSAQGIALKKRYGQHFLRDSSVTDTIVSSVPLNAQSSVFEIGCGDGFLTRAILQQDIARLWVFEIDHEWAGYVRRSLNDPRLEVFEENILDLDFEQFEQYKPWILLANLPYQITYPILRVLHRNRHLLQEGVIMIQEEVAEKILKTSGRGYGYPSLFFQRYFEWKKLSKVLPGAFYPPPKVVSRLLHFKPRLDVEPIPDEEEFWKFIKVCFHQPRRTLRNNLAQAHYDLALVPEELFSLRAQQMKMPEFIELWNIVRMSDHVPQIDVDESDDYPD